MGSCFSIFTFASMVIAIAYIWEDVCTCSPSVAFLPHKRIFRPDKSTIASCAITAIIDRSAAAPSHRLYAQLTMERSWLLLYLDSKFFNVSYLSRHEARYYALCCTCALQSRSSILKCSGNARSCLAPGACMSRRIVVSYTDTVVWIVRIQSLDGHDPERPGEATIL
jgi:hypothetical protein